MPSEASTSVPQPALPTGDSIPLPWRTIEREVLSGEGGLYEEKQPAFIVLTSPDDSTRIGGWITTEARAPLRALNYERFFVVALFQGWKPSGSYQVEIEEVLRQDGTVTVKARFLEPTPGYQIPDLVTSPYHIIVVEKEGAWNQEIRFLLQANDEVMEAGTYFIP